MQEEIRASGGAYLRRLFRRGPAAQAAEAAAAGPEGGDGGLSPEQAGEVRRVAFERAAALGLDDDRAGLLADAVAGALLVR